MTVSLCLMNVFNHLIRAAMCDTSPSTSLRPTSQPEAIGQVALADPLGRFSAALGRPQCAI